METDKGANEKFCFSVTAFNEWEESGGVGAAGQVCAIAAYDPGTPSPTGISAIHVFNCHNDNQSVRIWTYDLTVNNGLWQDHGVLARLCNASPMVINLTDGHSYNIKALDCGNAPPPQTLGTCHRTTNLNPIPGKTGGIVLPFTVN
ncbi:MAG: hypothetical protein JNK89_08080 [Saprospiraceae bacterium]|nr:hypothetical protein [Saprospiraceae bacterium]